MFTRVAVGGARVVREVRATAPLMAALNTPVTARGPWLTAVLNQGAAHRPRVRPVAVVVEPHPQGRPDAVAFLELRRRGFATTVTLLGEGTTPLPPGAPTFRLPARNEQAAVRLAAGILELLNSLRGPWTLRLAGLPLGDPTVAALAARLPTAVVSNSRSARLVDELDGVGAVVRSRDPVLLERRLPELLGREPHGRTREFLRPAGRLHAAIGQLEVAVVAEGEDVRAVLLTLVEGAARWPWWGSTDIGGLRTELGAPLVQLTAPADGWPPMPATGRRRSGLYRSR